MASIALFPAAVSAASPGNTPSRRFRVTRLKSKKLDRTRAFLQHSLYKGTNQWMDDVGGGGAFGLEQGKHIERMCCELKGACLPIMVQPGDTHVAIVEKVLILERRAEVTVVLLSYFVFP